MNRNKNRSRKLIEFKRGEFCIFPSTKLYWKNELNTKYLTRQSAKEARQNMDKKFQIFNNRKITKIKK